MARLRPQAETLYGTPQPLSGQNPTPVIAKRDPTATDTGFAPGQLWANSTSGAYFGLASVHAGVATWTTLGNVTSTYTTLTSGSYATTTANAITLASGNVFSGTGANASIGFTFTPKGSGGVTVTTGNITATNGNLVTGTAGNGLVLKSGANARIGQTTLVLGTKAVANTSVTANTRVFLTRTSAGASTALGVLEAVINAGVGFTINSYTPATAVVETNDVSVIDWVLVESA